MAYKIYDIMCKRCWYSWRKESDAELKEIKRSAQCPKCRSKDVDIDFDVSE